MSLRSRFSPVLDGAAVQVGDGTVQPRSLVIPASEYATPFWLRPDGADGRVVRVDSLPWRGVLSAGQIEVLSSAPAPPASSAIFHSDWSTATGKTSQALTDGGKWLELLNNGDALTVVDGPTYDMPSAHCLEVWAVPGGAGAYAANPRVWGLGVPAVGTSRYYRWYFRCTVPDSYNIDPGSHPIQDYTNGTMGQTNWFFDVITHTDGTWEGCWNVVYTGEAYPNHRWTPLDFNKNQTYRFELQIERISTTNFRIHTRVYDSSDVLLYTDADFWNIDLSDNLASWYAAGNSFTFANVNNLDLFQCGHNDYSGGTASDYDWPISYQGGFAIWDSPLTDAWIGAYAGGV